MQTEQSFSISKPAEIHRPSTALPPALRLLLRFLGLTVLFAIAYAQSPLYTSNQNQYFLHGLAAAGHGTLTADWLANTLDPTPLFSLLVRLTHPLSGLFYIYYALLMGVYLVCGDSVSWLPAQGEVGFVKQLGCYRRSHGSRCAALRSLWVFAAAKGLEL